jgi:hypothetical protein
MGVVPEAFVGDLLGFTTADIEKMRRMGYEDAGRPLVDMCEGYTRGSDAGGGTREVIIAAACGAVGGAVLMLASTSVISYCRRRRNLQPNGGISPQSNLTAFAAGQYRRV